MKNLENIFLEAHAHWFGQWDDLVPHLLCPAFSPPAAESSENGGISYPWGLCPILNKGQMPQ